MDPLTELENRIRSRPADMPPELGNRIMSAIAQDLSSDRVPASASAWWRRSWAWAAAALVLVALNLSLVTASANSFSFHDRSPERPASEMQAIDWLERLLDVASSPPHQTTKEILQ